MAGNSTKSGLDVRATMDLSIIIVNWNSEDYLRQCLAGIYENTAGMAFEILVVDNASPAGKVDAVCCDYPAVKLVKSAENLGFARANNLGFRHSIGEYVLFLNPDTKVVGNAINRLLHQARELRDMGIIGGKLVDPDMAVQTTSIQKFPTILNQMADIEYLRRRFPHCRLWGIGPLFTRPEAVTRVEVIPGACMLLRRDVFVRVGGFSENYFMYAEDIDLNWKVARARLASYYVPEAIIVHYGGTSSRQQKVNEWATIMKYRAMRQYYVRNHGPLYAGTYQLAMASMAGLRLVVFVPLLGIARLRHRPSPVRQAFAKWIAVLKWALGLDDWALQAR